MKALSPVSSFRMATAAAGLAILAISPAWADKYASIVVDMDTAKVLHARDADDLRRVLTWICSPKVGSSWSTAPSPAPRWH